MPKDKGQHVKIGIYVDEADHRKLAKLAEQGGLSLSAWCRIRLRESIQKEARRSA